MRCKSLILRWRFFWRTVALTMSKDRQLQISALTVWSDTSEDVRLILTTKVSILIAHDILSPLVCSISTAVCALRLSNVDSGSRKNAMLGTVITYLLRFGRSLRDRYIRWTAERRGLSEKEIEEQYGRPCVVCKSRFIPRFEHHYLCSKCEKSYIKCWANEC